MNKGSQLPIQMIGKVVSLGGIGSSATAMKSGGVLVIDEQGNHTRFVLHSAIKRVAISDATSLGCRCGQRQHGSHPGMGVGTSVVAFPKNL